MAWRLPRAIIILGPTVAAGMTSFRGTVETMEAPTSPEDPSTKDKVREPTTGISFPRECLAEEEKEPVNMKLVGAAVRCMLGQCRYSLARAYAVGLYVQEGEEARRWQQHANECRASSPDARAEAACFAKKFEQVLALQGVARRLVLVMDRDVAGHHIAKGFDKSLLHRVRNAQGGRQGPGKQALKRFTAVFSKVPLFKAGTKITMTWTPSGVLTMDIDGRYAEPR
eukprot:jgi/Mesvir1/11689/Mv00081-RA.1